MRLNFVGKRLVPNRLAAETGALRAREHKTLVQIDASPLAPAHTHTGRIAGLTNEALDIPIENRVVVVSTRTER